MTRARSQPTGHSVNPEYAYQVTVRAKAVGGENLDAVFLFHVQIDQLQHSRLIRKDDEWFQVFHFADLRYARSFQAIFGGVLSDHLRP